MSPFKVVIPARMASTRLPGKPLLLIDGIPMVVHVLRQAQESGAEEVVVATDDQAVVDAVTQYGGQAIMTSADHASGTDRIAEVAARMDWGSDTVVVNVQGDEPFTEVAHIQQLATLLDDPAVLMGTLAASIVERAQLESPNVVKVVINGQNEALYFSRSVIPYDRNDQRDERLVFHGLAPWRHVGMYAYRVQFLQSFVTWEPSALEQLECLEQLRALHHGICIRVGIIDEPAAPGIDTPEDLVWANNRNREKNS